MHLKIKCCKSCFNLSSDCVFSAALVSSSLVTRISTLDKALHVPAHHQLWSTQLLRV